MLIGVLEDTDISQGNQLTTAALVAKSTQEEKSPIPATSKTAKPVLRIVIVQNANQGILSNTRTTLMSVLSATMLIAPNVKITLDIVKLVFTVLPYISQNKSVKSPSSIIVRVSSMEDAKYAMMGTELLLISNAQMTAKLKIVKCAKMTNHAQNASLDSN